jgi:2-C-methyl-D-erythritol 2,4-cyclodiphosphate synthase
VVLLKRVGELLEENHYIIENIDATIIAQNPKMRPYIDDMRKNVADALGIEITQVNIKATTEEGLGFTGNLEGISSQAICMISSMRELAGYMPERDILGCEGCPGCANIDRNG